MKSYLLVLGFLLIASNGFSETREVIQCQNDHYALVVRETAVPTYRSATLTFSERSISLKCQVEFQNQDKSVSITCEEDRAGDDRYLAGITLVNLKGNADIAHEQMYPLKPKSLATLPCEVTQE